tara:strand:+ start:907 stop:1161 length:255 start_codon:yes stop_codon:yes gene_type:complete
MPEYECPYCGHDSDHVDDMTDPDISYETECDLCEKVFFVQVEYYASYSPITAEAEQVAVDAANARHSRMMDRFRENALSPTEGK